MYNSKAILDKEDLQKNRWGGENRNNGKQLTATVKKSSVPGLFKITLTVSSLDSTQPFMGDVAFFLHDSFTNEIRYRKSISNAASITVTAYEAFTAGVFTADGTMLEIDLNKEVGFPKEFYYKD